VHESELIQETKGEPQFWDFELAGEIRARRGADIILDDFDAQDTIGLRAEKSGDAYNC